MNRLFLLPFFSLYRSSPPPPFVSTSSIPIIFQHEQCENLCTIRWKMTCVFFHCILSLHRCQIGYDPLWQLTECIQTPSNFMQTTYIFQSKQTLNMTLMNRQSDPITEMKSIDVCLPFSENRFFRSMCLCVFSTRRTWHMDEASHLQTGYVLWVSINKLNSFFRAVYVERIVVIKYMNDEQKSYR